MKPNHRMLSVLLSAMLLLVSSSAARQPFRITYPKDNAKVEREVITLKGDGADPNAELEVWVTTDEDYPQDGRGVIDPDGKWSYSGCKLKGIGEHNDHEIRVDLKKNGRVVASDSVDHIVRKGPTGR